MADVKDVKPALSAAVNEALLKHVRTIQLNPTELAAISSELMAQFTIAEIPKKPEPPKPVAPPVPVPTQPPAPPAAAVPVVPPTPPGVAK